MEYDLAIVGAGINGACIARDAAGRGLRVLLVERGDLASHTAAGSPKIIHGGLRYLRHLEVSMVREALAERDLMLQLAPHAVQPLSFVLPHAPGQRPLWAVRLESLIYNHLARRSGLPGSRLVALHEHPAGAPLREGFERALEFTDAWTDDARLVVLNCLDASERGATILPRTECIATEREENVWRLWLRSQRDEEFDVTARALVNATGPWAQRFLSERSPLHALHGIRLVKSSHIVLPRLFDHPYAYVFEAEGGHLVMALPYGEFTLIGNLERDFDGDPARAGIDAEEVAWLCAQASAFFNCRVGPGDVRRSFSAVRSLPEDVHAGDEEMSWRDHVLVADSNGPPVVSIFGGRVATSRLLAQKALACVQPALGNDVPDWTHGAPLPGGDIPGGDFTRFAEELQHQYPTLPAPLLLRLARAYGTRVQRMLGHPAHPAPLGEEVLPGLFEAELNYLTQQEWADSADDILWRRTHLGLQLGPDAGARLQDWLDRRATA